MALSDDFPVLLGPVRLETRFTDTELLVRVFPDEWSIDKFEPQPTQAEIGALDAYWVALWRSGGDTLVEQAAWQELVARVPVGRATWLLSSRVPANPAERPRPAAGTTVLVIVTPQAYPAADKAPATTYWTALWRAHGDPVKSAAAHAALIAEVGATRADTIRGRRPAGFDAANGSGPAPEPAAPVVLGFLVLAPPTGLAARSWTQAARATLLPDRFRLLGYVGGQQVVAVTGQPVPASLLVSPDPAAAAADKPKVNEQTGVLQVPDAMRWLTDFTRAVAVGMGFRVPLTPAIRGGLDRLVVFGLREQATPAQSATDLAGLFTRQSRSPAGFALLPQGTPTNNTEETPAGPDPREDAESGRRTALGTIAAAAPGDWTARTDGQCFAEALGIDPATLGGVPNADRTDERDARAANVALWPATWGAYLRTALHPALSAETVAQTRAFFVRHVSGRGPVPAVRIGRQPYGILPTTAFSRLAWPAAATHRRGLHQVLTAAAQDWRAATARVARLGAGGDPHQLLLDILALHPTSAEYHQRYAQSVEDIFNRENLGSGGPQVLPALAGLNQPQPILALLARLGYPVQPPLRPEPDLVRRLFTDAQYPLLGPLVDDRPPSETEPVRGGYLRWLAEHAGTDLNTIRLERGLSGRPPGALLYLLLRHAVLLGWDETARALAAAATGQPVPSPDPLFVHIRLADPAPPSESRFRRLYSPDPAVTGSPTQLVVDAIPGLLGRSPATAALAEQVQALGLLADLPTARLERLLAEHLDCATYRLDAWLLGLANERLAELRFPVAGAPARSGVHLGAYGWLEEVRPRTRALTQVPLTGDLATVFGASTLPHDPTNGGYVHAPSPAHAATAAVLRAGYLANATPDSPGAFAINLSSERVRVALGLLDGLRQGQSLGALLGQRLERALHDRYQDVELDKFLPALRGAFPLRAGRLSGADADDVDLVEARNVIDGLELVRRATRPPAQPSYPYGAEGLPPATEQERQAMDAEVQRLLDIHDALADLAVAEGTYQALTGNPERAAATFDAYAKEGFPPEPSVVQTPQSGVTLTHRMGVVFRAGLDPNLGAGPIRGDGPRARAEPAVNDWLPQLLPAAQQVAALVTWTDPVSGQGRSRVVTQADADLQPIDLLWALRPADEAAMTDLDDRILGVVAQQDQPRPDTELTIRHTQRVAGKVTFFELSPLVAAARTLLTTARPLRPTDLVPAAGADPADRTLDTAIGVPRNRPAAVRTALAQLRDTATGLINDLTPLLPAPPAAPKTAQLVAGVDGFLTRHAQMATTAGGFGMLRSGWGEASAWRRDVFRDVLAEVAATAARLGRSLASADALLAAYNQLPANAPADDRFRLLQQAERLLTTKPTTPRPAQPAQLRSTVLARRAAFNNRLQALQAVARTGRKTLSGLLADVSALLPLSDFDATGLSLDPVYQRVVLYCGGLLTRATALRVEVLRRLAAGDAALADYDKALTGPDRVQAARTALTEMIGPDVLVVPEFTPPAQLDSDWRKARGDSSKLLRHLTQSFNRDYPVDDWLHGIARVRDKPRLWERAVLLSDALRDTGGLLGDILGGQEPELLPIQLPFRTDDHWLGMEFAPGTAITEDKVLFTAHYAAEPPLVGNPARCGLLLDEWTDVIPAAEETTSIAVHFDRPDSEPPQAMLLVVPPVKTGTWNPDDLIAAITDTFDLAQLRAVEPHHLDNTAYAHLLPATLISATRQPVTIGTDLALNNLRRADD
ncbi:hypothetical protein [Dactylosporangium sp. NPDC049140]|uniref:hypothetical protein n=1 Tax=Dactylosporangium sp. NPDC049140 TaxID=3155647 RepID=UPI0033EF8689